MNGNMSKKLRKSICACGFLERYERDPLVPIEHNGRDGYTYLTSKTSQGLKINYCFVCGGKKFGFFSDSSDKCACNYVCRLLEQDAYPIAFNEEFREYCIIDAQGRGESLLHFCFACSGRMPESVRDQSFYPQSEAEKNQLSAKLKSLKSIDEVIAVLGKPDYEHGGRKEDLLRNGIYELVGIKRTLEYRCVAKTFVLQVLENQDEKVTFFFAGKPLKRSIRRRPGRNDLEDSQRR